VNVENVCVFEYGVNADTKARTLQNNVLQKSLFFIVVSVE